MKIKAPWGPLRVWGPQESIPCFSPPLSGPEQSPTTYSVGSVYINGRSCQTSFQKADISLFVQIFPWTCSLFHGIYCSYIENASNLYYTLAKEEITKLLDAASP